MTAASRQYWADQHLTPAEQLAAVAAEYAGKIVAAFPRATPPQLTTHIATFTPLAESTFRSRFRSDPPAPMSAALATAVDALLVPTPQ